MSSNEKPNVVAAVAPAQRKKLALFALLVLASFLLTYNYAVARGNTAAGAAGSSSAGSGLFSKAGGGCAMSGGSGGGGCCGGGGPAVEGSTTVEGDVQKIAVDTSSGSFNPNVIKAKAGVPIVLDFSQSAGGCLSGVYFPDFDINEDLSTGPKTVTLPALQPGEYQFFCQMQMVSAKIVVE